MAENGIEIKIREMILTGVLPAGRRVTEAGLAEQLNVSRTPVRNILPALALEGLLERVGKRGFAVKGFSLSESLEALTLRSVLEGMAAAIVARSELSEPVLAALHACLTEGDAIFQKRYLSPDDESTYATMNNRFHFLIVHAAGSSLLNDMYDRVNLVPFTAPVAIAFEELGLERAYDHLSYAHRQHHAIVAAIVSRDAGRAEFLFREHANTQRSSLSARESPVAPPFASRRTKVTSV